MSEEISVSNEENNPKTYAVIDGNSFMHRAFHAVQASMNAPDGTPTNAAFGFMSMFLKMMETLKPDAVICAFDKGRPQFRMDALEQYKAQRPPMDPDLKVQFPLVEKLLESLSIPVVSLPGWEGDDILGTIAARNEKLGNKTLLVTGDKDAYQLASELTRIVTTKKGITDIAVYGPAEVEERYGVTPAQFPDFLGLKGDSADNIPGVKGIGDKKAASMLQEYGSIEGIYENIDSFKGKQKENLINGKDDAFISRQVATIVTDVEFDLDLDAVSFPSFDPEKVTEAFSEVRFNAHLGKVLALCPTAVAPQTEIEYETILTAAESDVFFEELCQASEKGSDSELGEGSSSDSEKESSLDLKKTSGSDAAEEIGVAFSHDPQTNLFSSGLVLAVNTEKGTAIFDQNTSHSPESVVAWLIANKEFSVYDGKEFAQLIFPKDVNKEAFVTEEEMLAASFFDVSLAEYVCDAAKGSSSLENLVQDYLGSVIPDEQNQNKTFSFKACCVRLLKEPLKKQLQERNAEEVYYSIDLPLVGVLACMERTGAEIDNDMLSALGQETGQVIEALKAHIIELAGEDFNVDSPKQLGHILFEVMGFDPIKKTKSGFSTDASVLGELAKKIPADQPNIAEEVLQYREFAKIKSTYIDALPKMAQRAEDGRVHTSFNERITATGRLSSSDPNLQNIPVRSEFGRKIRETFIPFANHDYFVSADYSQIELRLLAHLSGDEHLINAFNSGEDFHANTASRVFGVPVEQVTPQMRSRAKAVNFGIVYGQQAYGLAQSLGVSFSEAKDMIDRYYEAYPQVRTYLDETVEMARQNGYAETLFGRRRYIPDLKSRNAAKRSFGERTAMNHPMQGSAADIIKIAMRNVQEELVSSGKSSKLLLQVHDELDLSVPKEELEEVSAQVKEIMESVVSLSVPLLVDVSWGKNWAEAH
ncbi:MAG: DNA polymerase I [Anaerotardibacter sp.]